MRLAIGMFWNFDSGVALDPWVVFVFGKATGDGRGLGGSGQRGLAAHPGEAIAELEGHLHEESSAYEHQAPVGQALFDAGEEGGEAFEILFVTRDVLLLHALELHLFEQVDLVLVFDVPSPESGFGDVDFLRDFVKAPAISAKRHEGADFVYGMHGILLGLSVVGRTDEMGRKNGTAVPFWFL